MTISQLKLASNVILIDLAEYDLWRSKNSDKIDSKNRWPYIIAHRYQIGHLRHAANYLSDWKKTIILCIDDQKYNDGKQLIEQNG